MSYLKAFFLFILKWIVIVSLFGGFIFYMKVRDGDREAKAQDELAPYNAQIERYLVKKSVSQRRIPAQGNVVFVDEKTRRLDKFSDYNLSPDNVPKTPSDVDSVVLHDCHYLQVGSYTNGARAMQHVCQFTVIDVASGSWSNWGEFRGTMPADEIKRRRGSSSDEIGGRAIYSFFAVGGLTSGKPAPQ